MKKSHQFLLLFLLIGCSTTNDDKISNVTFSLSGELDNQQYLLVVVPVDPPQYIDFLPFDYGNYFLIDSDNPVQTTLERDLTYNISVYSTTAGFYEGLSKQRYLEYTEELVTDNIDVSFNQENAHYTIDLN